MIFNIKPGDLNEEIEFEEFKNILNSRQEGSFCIDLEETSQMNLSKFNALVKLYVGLRRAGRSLCYANLHDSVRFFVDKTNFHHVFNS